MRISDRSFRNTVIVFALLFIGLSGISYFIFQQTLRERIKAEEYKLEAISNLEVDQINNWISSMKLDAKNAAEDFKIMPEQESLVHFKKEHNYERIDIIDKNFNVIFSTGNKTTPVCADLKPAIAKAFFSNKIILSDLYECEEKVYLGSIVPLPSSKKPYGGNVMLLATDPDKTIYKLVNFWPVKSRTSENLFVRRKGDHILFLNKLRFNSSKILSLKMPLSKKDLPAAQAVLGKKGVFVGKDYKGAKVLSFLNHVPGTSWYLVTKTDMSEILEPYLGNLIYNILLEAFLLFLGIFAVIAERKRSETEILAEKERLIVTLRSIGDAVIATDCFGNVTILNKIAENLTGWAQKEAIGRKIEEVFKIINEDTLKPCENPVEKVLKLGKIIGLANHTALIAKDGTMRSIADSGAPIFDKSGKVLGVILVFRDVTHERKIETLLRLSEEKFRGLYNSIVDGLVRANMDGTFIEGNQAFADMTGYSINEISKLNFRRLTPDKWLQVEDKIFREQLFTRGFSDEYEKEYIKKDGTLFPVSIKVWLIKDEKGMPCGFWKLVRDITKRKQLEQVKDDFISMISHELRTPMSILKEGISQIHEGIHGNITEEQKHILGISLNNVDRLARLINNLLDMSKIESGKVELNRKDVNLVNTAKKVIAGFKIKAKEKGLEIKENFGKEVIIASADEDQIEEIFTNLIGNAIKFTGKGEIGVSIEEMPDSIICSVLDTGIGISKENMKKLFSKFEQFGRSAGAGEKGTGLGLAIAKGLIDLHHGKIWVESKLGVGSKFSFSLPK